MYPSSLAESFRDRDYIPRTAAWFHAACEGDGDEKPEPPSAPAEEERPEEARPEERQEPEPVGVEAVVPGLAETPVAAGAEQEQANEPADEQEYSSDMEEVLPLFAAAALRHHGQIIVRGKDASGNRYYRRKIDGLLFSRQSPSVTTIIKKTSETSECLIKWIIEHGWAEAARRRDAAAAYGTFMHIVFAKYMMAWRDEEGFDFRVLDVFVKEYIEEHGLAGMRCLFNPSNGRNETELWPSLIKSDIRAFEQWLTVYNVVPLAIEMPFVFDDGKDVFFGGCIDLACRMDFGVYQKSGPGFQKGDLKKDCSPPKPGEDAVTKICLIDFKSGRNNGYPEHAIQSAFYRLAWDLLGIGPKIERQFNWHPKAWHGTQKRFAMPEYTGKVSEKAVRCRAAHFNTSFGFKPPRKMEDKFGGIVRRGVF